MAGSQMSPIVQHLRKSVLRPDGSGMTDGQLLESFIAGRDEAAFEALVRRHGPMVLGVCRRVLGNHHDAQDAFQAAFLVLARKAASVSPREMVGNFLYGVARTTALRAKVANARRRARERQVAQMPEPETVPHDPWDDLQPLLDAELARLPEKYRMPIVLCDLEGRARREVARQLQVPEGTLSSRLTMARKLLAKRLARHGLAVSGGLLAALPENTPAAFLPVSLVSSTVKAAALVAGGRAAGGVISANVAALTEGVLKTMLLKKLKFALTVLLMALLVCSGIRLLARLDGAQAEPSSKPGAGKVSRPEDGGRNTLNVRVKLDEVDAALRTVTASYAQLQKVAVTFNGKPAVAQMGVESRLVKVVVAADARIRDGGKAIDLTDLKAGMSVTLELRAGESGLVVVGVRKHEKEVGAGKREAPSDPPRATGDMAWDRLGLKLEAVGPAAVFQTNKQLRGGMRVVAVRKMTPAANGKHGPSPAFEEKLRPGDILVGLHHWETVSGDNVQFALGACQEAGMESLRYVLVRENRILEGRFVVPVESGRR